MDMSTEAVTSGTVSPSPPNRPKACAVVNPDGKIDHVAVANYNTKVDEGHQFESASGVLGPIALCAACEKRFSTDLAGVGQFPAGCHKLGATAIGPQEGPPASPAVPSPRPQTL